MTIKSCKHYYDFYLDNDICDSEQCCIYYDTTNKELADICAKAQAAIFDEDWDYKVKPEEIKDVDIYDYHKQDIKETLTEGLDSVERQIKELNSLRTEIKSCLNNLD